MFNNLWKHIKSLRTLGYKMLPNLNREYYMYKRAEFQAKHCFSLDIKDEEATIEDIYVYGWVIEMSWKDRKEEWHNHWNHTLYNSKESAMDAINQMSFVSRSGYNGMSYHMRVLPLYNFKNNGFRSYIITKILQEENK